MNPESDERKARHLVCTLTSCSVITLKLRRLYGYDIESYAGKEPQLQIHNMKV